MSNPYLKVSYPKQPWYRDAIQTTRAIIGRTLSRTSEGIANAINYTGNGIIQAADMTAHIFPWYRSMPNQDKLGNMYSKYIFRPTQQYINQAALNDQRNFSYPGSMDNSTKNIIDNYVVAPADMIASGVASGGMSKVPQALKYASPYADKAYKLMHTGIRTALGNGTDLLSIGGQAADALGAGIKNR